MSEQDNPTSPDEVEGHMPVRRGADAERDESDDDVAGQASRSADGERDETEEDVEGHFSGALGPKRRKDFS